MVGIKIGNETNINDKCIGITFRRRDQLSADVIWQLLEKVAQSNSNFAATDTLVINVDIVKMPSGNGRVKARGRSMESLVHLKRSIVSVKATHNCLAHALVIAMARVENDDNYTAYRKGYKIEPIVSELLARTGIDLGNGGGLPELQRFSDCLPQYRIVVFDGFTENNIMFDSGRTNKKTLNLLYDDATKHYSVITSVAGCFAQWYICQGLQQGL